MEGEPISRPPLTRGQIAAVAQSLETVLTRWSGNPAAPGWYMSAAAVAGICGALLIPEPPRVSVPRKSVPRRP